MFWNGRSCSEVGYSCFFKWRWCDEIRVLLEVLLDLLSCTKSTTNCRSSRAGICSYLFHLKEGVGTIFEKLLSYFKNYDDGRNPKYTILKVVSYQITINFVVGLWWRPIYNKRSGIIVVFCIRSPSFLLLM
jgi:hypothetical protein